MYVLITANRNYSSWSLRPWILMKGLGIAFTDRIEPFTKPSNYLDFRSFSPTGQVPALLHEGRTVYDSLGNPIEADIYYRKTGANSWEYKVLVDGETVSNGTPGTPSEIASGTLDFDTEGELTTHTPAATTFQPVDATQPQDITIDFTGSTQVAGDSSLKSLSQDGFAAGELRDIIIEQDGTITGVFSNGENADIGRVAMADFQAPEGLERLGGRLWRATPQSGEAVVGAPGTGKMGAVISGALEASNVDMSHEFVKMIAYQRGFQASSKAITTGDQLMSELINLKR